MIDKKLKKVIDYVEEKSGYIIFIRKGVGRLLSGNIIIDNERVKAAFIECDDKTQALHEMGHLLGTPEEKPFSKISILLREYTAWRIAECLAHKFKIKFDVESFDIGFSSYLLDLINSEECPSFEWLSQFIGE